MANIRRARRLSKKLHQDYSGRIRGITAIQMLLYTLILGVIVALPLCGITVPAVLTPFMVPIVFYVLGFISLFVNLPLTAVARKSEEGAFARMSFPRFLIMLILPVFPALIAWGFSLLVNLINTNWTLMFAWVLKDTMHISLSIAAVVVGIIVIILVCSTFGLFLRQIMLYMADSSERMTFGVIGKSFTNALSHMLSPTALFFTALFWFLLILILFALCLLGGALFVAKLTPDAIMATLAIEGGIQLLALQLLAALLALPMWYYAAAFAVSAIWILGLGLVFFPRWNTIRLYHCRLIMRDAEIL